MIMDSYKYLPDAEIKLSGKLSKKFIQIYLYPKIFYMNKKNAFNNYNVMRENAIK